MHGLYNACGCLYSLVDSSGREDCCVVHSSSGRANDTLLTGNTLFSAAGLRLGGTFF